MPMYIKPPRITAPTTEGKIQEIYQYLFQLQQQLNYMFSIIEKDKENE